MPTALGTIASQRTVTADPNNPFNMVAWHEAHWASDPLWAPPADGVSITSWRDGSGNNRSMTVTSGAGPYYRASALVMGFKPAVEFISEFWNMAGPTFTSMPHPYTMVAVFRPSTIDGDRWFLSGAGSSAVGINGNRYRMYSGADSYSAVGQPDTNAHLVIASFNEPSSTIEEDGVLVHGPVSIGNSAVTQWRLNSWAGGNSGGGFNTYAFIGFKAGLLTTTEKSNLLSWYNSYYASTIPPIPASGLVGWWDADDAATITHSTGAVSQWNDKSGGSRNVIQATAGNKPTTGSATRNGKNVLVFDGGDYLNYSGVTGLVSGGLTLFVVAGETVSNEFRGIFAAYSPGENDHNGGNSFVLESGYAPPTARIRLDHAFASADYPGTKPFPFGVWTAKIGGSAPLMQIWQDGVTAGGGAGGDWTGTSTGFLIGCRYLAAIDSGYGFTGQIAEIVIYNRILSTVERQQVEQYLANKWGTPISPIPTTGLIGWWDADDASTFTFSSGANVSQWRDKSTTPHHLAQATVGVQPVRSGSRNGKPTVVFANGPYLTYTGDTGLNVGAVTIFVVFGESAVVSNAAVVVAHGGVSDYNDPNSLFVSTYDGSYFVEAYRLGSLGVFAGNGVMPWSVTCIMFRPDGTGSVYYNGTPGTSGAGTPGTFGVATGGYVVGERWISGGIYGVKFNGDIGEIVVYDRVLSTTERQQVESYLKTKWGTP